MSARRACLAAAAVVLLALGVSRAARAQACTGIPMQHLRVGASRGDNGTVTLAGAVQVSRLSALSVNYALPENPPNGSKLLSFGGRLVYGFDRDGLGLCMLFGYQRGYAWLRNADGLRMNGHLKTSSLPVAMAFSVPLIRAPGTKLLLFVMPQVLLVSHELELFGRSDTLSTAEHPTRFGIEGGAALAVGPLRLTASAFRIRDLPSGWSIGAGVAW